MRSVKIVVVTDIEMRSVFLHYPVEIIPVFFAAIANSLKALCAPLSLGYPRLLPGGGLDSRKDLGMIPCERLFHCIAYRLRPCASAFSIYWNSHSLGRHSYRSWQSGLNRLDGTSGFFLAQHSPDAAPVIGDLDLDWAPMAMVERHWGIDAPPMQLVFRRQNFA